MPNKATQEERTDPLAPLIDAIRSGLRDELMAAVRSEVRALLAEGKPDKVMLSIPDVGRHYGIGRIALKQMIRDGKIPSITRRCRGGRMGTFVHAADCERILAGRKP